jgi:uncharacterized membrane protein YphA (DoxX/SURF4 family)
MRRIIDNDYLTMIFRLAVGLTFIYASYYKLIDPGAFARSIWYYHMVPGELLNLMALVLPMLELVCGLALIVGLWYRGSLLWVALMTVMFLVALLSAVARGIDIDCGCFKAGKASSDSALKALWFDLGLLVAVVQLLLSRSRRWMCDRA